MSTKFQYYNAREADQFTFYRIPKMLFTEPIFDGLTLEAKLLYGLMLDRMGLSIERGWVDEKGHPYIYFTQEHIQEHMKCGHSKATQLLRELDQGIGLIRRKRQGLGRPDRIYVMDFTTGVQSSDNQQSAAADTLAERPARENKTAEKQRSEIQCAENQQSRVPETRPQECREPAIIKNEINKTEISNTESIPHQPPCRKKTDGTDRIEKTKALLFDQWGYNALLDSHSKTDLDGIFNLGAEVISSQKATLRVGGEELPREQVVSRLLSLDFTHIDYVLDRLKSVRTTIRNMYSYLLTALYNAPLTIDAYYAALVARDEAAGRNTLPQVNFSPHIF